MIINKYFSPKKRTYPQSVKGRFRKLKWILNGVFMLIYFATPLIRFNRGEGLPNQGVLIDMTAGKIYYFILEIWPKETYYLASILVISALMLFFVTSLFGRVWCGYACFQTVWTDIFIAIERIFQGERNERILLDRKKSLEKFFKKFLTHFSWIIVSLVTGFGFVSYFNDIYWLFDNLFKAQINYNIWGWIIGIASATYIMAGFAREHVCIYMCPYAKFQSAMFDKDTLIITYDKNRGEPREKSNKNQDFTNRGHCIDCKQCVVVCPQDIDIRNGLQMECIACGLCIDACDNVMEKVGLPKGLIRYDTENNLENKNSKNSFKIFRARTYYYLIILITVTGITLFSLINKSNLEIDIISDRNPVTVKLSDGSTRNGYLLKIFNKTHEDKKFILTLNVSEGIEIKKFDDANYNFIDKNNIELITSKSSQSSFRLFIVASEEFSKQHSQQNYLNLFFTIKDAENNETQNFEAIFVIK